MLPFLYDGDGESSFALGDLLYVPSIREVVSSGAAEFDAYVISADGAYKKITLGLAPLTDDEKKIILCRLPYQLLSRGTLSHTAISAFDAARIPRYIMYCRHGLRNGEAPKRFIDMNG